MELKEFRLKNKLSQTEFAKIIGIPRTTYQSYEYGNQTPTGDNKLKIESAIRKIENIQVDKAAAIKSYERIQKYWDTYHQQIDDDFIEDDKLNLRLIKILSFILLVIILTVLW